jgi:steroid delta-isomerase-like uncharacterized protein
MAGADNVATVRRWTDQGFGEGKVELADVLVAEDFINHNPVPGQAPGREGLKAAVNSLRAAFPDLSVNLEDVISQGDKVVLRDTIRGTHQGPFAGVPPTGRTITVSRISVFRVVDGQIKEHWGLVDMLGVLQQLGAIPRPGAAA